MQHKSKSYLVTGGTGFLGEKLVELLINRGSNVTILSRNEGKLMTMKTKFPSIRIVPGDICNKLSVCQAFDGIQGVFHLAAFKHVRLAEEFAAECVNSNIIGTMNILDECKQRPEVEFVIGISTDKVAQVKGVYGGTKMIMESLFKQYEKNDKSTKYRLVRYGNVLYSTGSVLCIWKQLLSEGRSIRISDPNATRFYWTRESALNLIFNCLDNANSTKPYIPKMKSMRLGDLMEAMSMKYLKPGEKLIYETIGLQSSENLHEKMTDSGFDSNDVEKYTIPEIFNII
jgi:UDP-N-acetylglucosamine 4,6-dehydratase